MSTPQQMASSSGEQFTQRASTAPDGSETLPGPRLTVVVDRQRQLPFPNSADVAPPPVLFIVRQGTRKSDSSQNTWEMFLEQLVQAKALTPVQLSTLRRLSFEIRERFPSLHLPTAGRTEEGYEVIWDQGKHHLRIDVTPDGSFGWFHSNRQTRAFDGQEQLAPLRVSNALERISRLMSQD